MKIFFKNDDGTVVEHFIAVEEVKFNLQESYIKVRRPYLQKLTDFLLKYDIPYTVVNGETSVSVYFNLPELWSILI